MSCGLATAPVSGTLVGGYQLTKYSYEEIESKPIKYSLTPISFAWGTAMGGLCSFVNTFGGDPNLWMEPFHHTQFKLFDDQNDNNNSNTYSYVTIQSPYRIKAQGSHIDNFISFTDIKDTQFKVLSDMNSITQSQAVNMDVEFGNDVVKVNGHRTTSIYKWVYKASIRHSNNKIILTDNINTSSIQFHTNPELVKFIIDTVFSEYKNLNRIYLNK